MVGLAVTTVLPGTPQRDNDKLTVLSKPSQAITSVWASGFTTYRGQRAAEGLLGGNNRSKIILHPVVVETGATV